MTRQKILLLGTLLLQQGLVYLSVGASDVGNVEETCNSSLNIEEENQELTPPPSDGRDLGEPQQWIEHVSVTEWTAHIEAARLYMQSDQLKEKNIHPDLLKECRNKHKHCAAWSLMGECEANPKYMKAKCGPVCQSCDYLTIEGRCSMDDAGEDVWKSGDLDAMFERLVQEPYLSMYHVEVLSSPGINGGPWIITMEDVLSAAEAARLIELGAEEGYRQSKDVGKMLPNGKVEEVVSPGRTSTNAWCQNSCYEDTMARIIGQRVSDFVGIPEDNSEYIQLLRYEVGQFYEIHHDYIGIDKKRQCGPRILTVFLYLNNVEEGGGTNFSELDITVMPKLGRAVIWPSVTNDLPEKKDPRTRHQALPVTKGVKFGANMWFHLRNFKVPLDNNCI
ncbi:2-oxyglutarate/Fe(II) oxygenase [Nitzschia inconspicua]|uniref:2-oxyglutarate/Fe(II) oxygenase n=1 Tax=Nitzschia inconspicua TaxID=303405 RepID=A0A9K3KSU9_9STRA|nr:2-oxyglutarate/Fe(II) oxygenase [Nitzschia inconspicua]